MVQAAPRVLCHRQAIRLQRVHHLGCHFGAAGGRVLDLVKARVKTAKVVDGFGPGGKAHGGHRRVPVRADQHDGAGRGQLRRDLRHGRARRTGMQGKHGRAVGHEQDRARGRHGFFQGAIQGDEVDFRRLS